MAKGDINVHIGTTFSGEGFKKLENALKTSGGNMKKASGLVNQVVSGLGSMDSKAGKVVGTLGNLIGSFASMGFVGLAIGGITSAFQIVTNKINESKKAVKEMSEAIKNRLLAAMGDAEAKATLMQRGFQKMQEGLKRTHADDESSNDRQAQDETNEIKRKHVNDRSKMTDEHQIQLDKAREQYETGAVREERILEKAKAKWKLAADLLDAKRREQEATAQALEKAVADERAVREKSSSYLQKKEQLLNGKATMEEYAKERPWEAYKWNRQAGKFDLALEKHDKENSTDVERLKRASRIVADAQERNKKAIEEVTRLQVELAQAAEEEKSATLQYDTNMKVLDETMREQQRAVAKSVEAEKKHAEQEKKREAAEKKRKEEEERRKLEQEQDKANRRKIRDLERATAKRLSEMLPEIEKMKKTAQDWSDKAKDASGKTFSEWRGDERRKGRDEERQVNAKLKNITNAQEQRKQIGERIFDRNGRLRRSANKSDIEAYRKLGEYISLQSNNDPKLQEAARREQDKIGKRIFDRNGRLKRSANRQDVQRWKDLQSSFIKPDNPVQNLKDMEQEKNKYVKQQADDIKVIKDKLDKLGL